MQPGLRSASLFLVAVAGLLLGASNACAVSRISIQIATMEGTAGQARNVSLDYQLTASHSTSKSTAAQNLPSKSLQSQTPALKIKAQIKPTDAAAWSDASLVCNVFQFPQAAHQTWACEQGRLITAHINAPFTLNVDTSKHSDVNHIAATLSLDQASLSDAAGLHAGEKITAKFTAKAAQEGKQESKQWRWQASLDWLAGEAFWQPFYFASAGHQLQASGVLNEQFLNIDSASLHLKDVGQASFSGQMRLSDQSLQALALKAPDLNLEAMYPLLLKPLLEKTALNNLEMAGSASLQLNIQGGEPTSFQLDLADVDVDDKEQRFALYKLNANIPWDYDEMKSASLGYAGGNLLKVPLGAANLKAELNRYALTAPQLTLPVLDGALNLSDVSAAWVNNEWHWHLRANVVPIDMVGLSQALGLPRMEGKVAASIPMVTYSGGQLGVDGEMGFNLFEGSILVKHLAMQTPLGKAPRLNADLQMRNLDLGALTRTFAFGAIEGKLDGDVNNLQLLNWKPVNFDVDFHSSRGRYPKKISQRAVENISALGGAGAAAAIQRSFLRFLKEFNYEKIGLTCKLRNDTCEMGGVESTAQGYIIVKGSGVPSITVMGYNHSVSWGDLLERIARITAGNVTPVIK